MITLIACVVLIVIGILLLKNSNYDTLGFIIIVFVSVFLFIHICGWSLKSYDYEIFVTNRNAFEETLKNARESNNKYEVASIVKDIASWNMKLAEKKYYNKLLFFDQYIDDRIELLEPIK